MVGNINNNLANYYTQQQPSNPIEQTQEALTSPLKDPTQQCQTCASRTYQDGSNDPSVSFQTPQHIAPESSAAVVMSHEQEHVTNEKSNADSEGREVLSQNVILHIATCEECSRSYVSGGTTTTTTAAKKTYQDMQNPEQPSAFTLGA